MYILSNSKNILNNSNSKNILSRSNRILFCSLTQVNEGTAASSKHTKRAIADVYYEQFEEYIAPLSCPPPQKRLIPNNSMNMYIPNNLRNVLRKTIISYLSFLFLFFLACLWHATSHNQINELLRAVSIQSGYHRCSLYWLSSSASYPNNSRNMYVINNSKNVLNKG